MIQVFVFNIDFHITFDNIHNDIWLTVDDVHNILLSQMFDKDTVLASHDGKRLQLVLETTPNPPIPMSTWRGDY